MFDDNEFMISAILIGVFYGVGIITLWELGKWLVSLIF
jgi:hypothetical protein